MIAKGCLVFKSNSQTVFECNSQPWLRTDTSTAFVVNIFWRISSHTVRAVYTRTHSSSHCSEIETSCHTGTRLSWNKEVHSPNEEPLSSTSRGSGSLNHQLFSSPLSLLLEEYCICWRWWSPTTQCEWSTACICLSLCSSSVSSTTASGPTGPVSAVCEPDPELRSLAIYIPPLCGSALCCVKLGGGGSGHVPQVCVRSVRVRCCLCVT